MSVTWTNDRELEFLEYFQSEPVLWNTNLKHYKNKLKNLDAWNRLSALMEIPTDELKNKKTSLFASYRGYKNKVKKSENSGAGVDDVYKPIWFAYEIIDSFLGNTTKCKKTINTEEQSTTSNGENEEQIQLEENQSNQNLQADVQSPTNATAVSTIRRRQHPTELFEAEKVMKEAMCTFNETVKRNASQSIPKEDDDCDLYAKLLSKKLRKLPEGKRLRLMHDIDGMFLGLQSESSSPVPTPSPQPQHARQFILSRKSSHDQYQQRPGTSSSSHPEPIIQYSPESTPSPQPQHASQFIQSRKSSQDQYQQRPGTSSSSHSEPIIQYSPVPTPSPQPQRASQFILSPKSSNDQYQQRPGTSSSSHSEPIIQYSPVPTPSPQSQQAIQFIPHESSHDRYQQRPGTSSSSHSEPIIQYSPVPTPSPQSQHAIQFIPHESSHDRYQQRPGTSSSSHSEPIIQYSPVPTPSPQSQHAIQFIPHESSHDRYQQRPGTSSSSDSEPIIHYSPVPTPSPQSQHAIQFTPHESSHDQYQQRPGTSSSSHTEPIIHYSPVPNSNIIIQSNDVLYPPVIHIPDPNTSAEIGNVTNEGLPSPNALFRENNKATSNIIKEAFQLCNT